MKTDFQSLLLVALLVAPSWLLAAEPPQDPKKNQFVFQLTNYSLGQKPLSGEAGCCADATAECKQCAKACTDAKTCTDAKSCADAKACAPCGKCSPAGTACCPAGLACCPAGSGCCPPAPKVAIMDSLPVIELDCGDGEESIGIDFDLDMQSIVALPSKEYAQLVAEHARLEERVKLMEQMNKDRMVSYEGFIRMQKESFAQIIEFTKKNAKLETELAAAREKNEYMSSLTDSLVQRAALEARLSLLSEQGAYAQASYVGGETRLESTYTQVLNALQELQRASVRSRPMPVPFASSVYGFEKELLSEPTTTTPVVVPEVTEAAARSSKVTTASSIK